MILCQLRSKIRINKLFLKIIPLFLNPNNDHSQISIIIDKKNIIVGKTNLDITKTIIDELNKKLPSIKLN